MSITTYSISNSPYVLFILFYYRLKNKSLLTSLVFICKYGEEMRQSHEVDNHHSAMGNAVGSAG
ncbi:hypothetical protein [Paenibacillus etheri]|uniref:hypothetical protein n=1 Tax=Paenibacillus etheri TaxID=1306852 RepID=UPI001ADF6BB9|nr:hypothetical protein [Paenibacillus etheri]